MKKILTHLLLAAALTVCLAASPIIITSPDNNPGTVYGTSWDGEDEETEPGTLIGQQWDMEGFVLDGSTLYIVGGYDMANGFGGFKPGDLFIKVGGAAPGFSPTSSAGQVSNSNYGYTHAIDLTQPVGATAATAGIYSLSGSSVLDSVTYDSLGSNPWRYASGGTQISARGINLSTTNDAGLFSALGLPAIGGNHYVLAVDLGFLSVATGTDVYFSYTMECGNDSLKGYYSGGFDRIPDRATSALLIGLGLAAVGLAALKRRKA